MNAESVMQMNRKIVDAFGIPEKNLLRVEIHLDPGEAPKVIAEYAIKPSSMNAADLDTIRKEYRLVEAEDASEQLD